MDWTATTLWWLATGVLVAAELATGTFYLLMLALGSAAGGVAAYLGLDETAQWITAAVVAAGATTGWYAKRARAPRSTPVQANSDANIDIGGVVQVERWHADGSARVAYRGSSWLVRHAGQGALAPGPHVIVTVQSGWLGVEPARPI